MPSSLKSHTETLQEMFAVAANERRMKEADAITAAIESLSRQGGDMSKNPENLDTSAERVYGIDISLVADMLELGMSAALLALYDEEAVQGQIDALRAAADRDAAGVHTGRASEAGDWMLVPREPTDEMLNASQEEMCRWSARTYHNDDEQTAIYKAMIAAAPAPGGGD